MDSYLTGFTVECTISHQSQLVLFANEYVLLFYHLYTSFPGLPIIQFLITCSMQNELEGKAWYHLSHDVNEYLGRQRGTVVANCYCEVHAQD